MCALHIIMHSYLVHNTAKNSSDNLPSYPPDNQRSSDVVYWRGDKDTAAGLELNYWYQIMLYLHRRFYLKR